MTSPPEANQPHRWERRWLTLSLLLLASLAAAPMYFATLQADEFCRAGRLHQKTVLASVQHEYFHWSGRWLGIGLEYLILAGNAQLPIYGGMLALVAVIYLWAIKSLLNALCPEISVRGRMLLAGVLLGLYFAGLPSTKDTCYWICGAVEYQLNLALALFAISQTIRAATRLAEQKPYWLCLLLAMVLTLAVTGIHELYGLMLFLVLLTGSLLAFVWRLAGRWLWASVTAVAWLGFLMNYLAPGNAIRIAGQENYGQPLVAMQIALATMAQTLPDWIFDFRLIVATLLLLICWPPSLVLKSCGDNTRQKLLRIALPVVWIMLLGGAFLGPSWGTGAVVASRTLAPAYMIFLIGWFLCWGLIVSSREATTAPFVTAHPNLRTLLVLAFAASLLCTGTARRVARELAGPLPRYAEAKDGRHRLLVGAGRAALDTVTVPRLTVQSDLIGFSELTPDPNNWINNCTANYYGVGKIQLEERD